MLCLFSSIFFWWFKFTEFNIDVLISEAYLYVLQAYIAFTVCEVQILSGA